VRYPASGKAEQQETSYYEALALLAEGDDAERTATVVVVAGGEEELIEIDGLISQRGQAEDGRVLEKTHPYKNQNRKDGPPAVKLVDLDGCGGMR